MIEGRQGGPTSAVDGRRCAPSGLCYLYLIIQVSASDDVDFWRTGAAGLMPLANLVTGVSGGLQPAHRAGCIAANRRPEGERQRVL